MHQKLPLISSRLILRPFEPRDTPAFARYRSDPEVARYQSWDVPYTLAQAERFVAEMQSTVPGAPGEWYQLALEARQGGALIGDCAFVLLAEDPRQAEIGFSLDRAYQGQGYATEAVR